MALTHHDGLSVNNLVSGTQTAGTVAVGAVTITGAQSRGRRVIATGGSSVVLSTRVTASSIIILTPCMSTTGYYKGANATVKTITAGKSFKICLHTGSNTAATGAVNWAILNPS